MGNGLNFADQDRRVPSFKNKLINGGFDVWQRGTLFSAHGLYTADRWKISGASLSVEQTAGLDVSKFGLNLTSTDVASQGILQRIESSNSFGISNKNVTLSFLCKSSGLSSGLSIFISKATLEDDFTNTELIDSTTDTIGTEIKRITFTVALNDVSNGLQIYISVSGATTETVTISDMQLEEGKRATAFEQRMVGFELGLCKRYFEYFYFRNCSYESASNSARHSVMFAVEKRVIPTIVASIIDANQDAVTTLYVRARVNGAGIKYVTMSGSADAEL